MGTIFFLGGLGLVVASLIYGVLYFMQQASHPANRGADPALDKKLQVEKNQTDIILNAIEDGVIMIDADKVIRLCNPAAARLTGWRQDETTGIDFSTVLKLADSTSQPYPPNKDPFSRALEEAETVRDNKAMLISKANKTLSINLSVSPIFNENEEVTGAVGIFRDVSEERQEERQRAEFISTASHEMRTPVAAIEGYLALALNDKVSKIDLHARDYLRKAHEATQHLGQLFQDLLTSAKAEDGRISNHPVIFEVSTFLEHVVDDLKFTAQTKKLPLEFVVGNTGRQITAESEGSTRVVTPLYYIQADPERIREVITNLFDNAVKYTEQGSISVGLTGDDNVVQIYVKDTGAGIPPDEIPHLFQKFYRIDNSATRVVGGTGLGLFICRKIVELYSGRIWVESELGKGSTFYINLPRIPNEKVTPAVAEAAKTAAVRAPEAT
jgi:PAS domain S-box-containing protein